MRRKTVRLLTLLVLLIGVAVCGQGYGKEWGGNLEVGDEERHVGFNKGAQLVEEQIEKYIQEHALEGARKLWISGYSRAAAVPEPVNRHLLMKKQNKKTDTTK